MHRLPRLSQKIWAASLLAAGFAVAVCSAPSPAADPQPAGNDKPVDFKKDVQPIFKASCIKCHSKPDPRNAGAPGGPGGAGPGGGRRGPGGPGGGPRGPAGNFRLDDKAAALQGGKAGNDIVPGKAEESLLIKLLTSPVTVGDHEIAQMPKGIRNQPAKPLAAPQVDIIKRWIDQGAKWPD
jgi:hypothetical protein